MATQWNAIAALVSVKLNRDNYLLWSSQLESVMESQELIQFIDGTFPAPSETIVKDGKSKVNPEFTV
uniref:Retrotransposon Copia-like N-terminal domain-containing protein n=1 Tax=Nymphaea colorata TaxID=210225 RepID=A0A5K1AEQ5_9MAGN